MRSRNYFVEIYANRVDWDNDSCKFLYKYYRKTDAMSHYSRIVLGNSPDVYIVRLIHYYKGGIYVLKHTCMPEKDLPF